MKIIKVLIVDDSKTETEILKNIFHSEPDLKVVGCAANGKEAIEMTKRLKPDVITMDIHMPSMDGIEATRVLMAQHPIPIVIISSHVKKIELKNSFLALEAGALCVLEKPVDISSPHFEQVRKHISATVRKMSEIKVIKRRMLVPSQKKSLISPPLVHNNFEIVAIGTSIGGPQALKTILSALPANFSLPIVIVQHMTSGFLDGFIKWLDANIALTVKEAEQNEILKGHHVYFAPDNHHLEVCRKNGMLFARLVSGAPVSGFCPSATVLLKSISNVCGKNAIGILLTGMGSDGAEGLLELKNQKGHTLIQDPNSTVVFGMAGVAQKMGAVDKVIELESFAEYLTKITRK